MAGPEIRRQRLAKLGELFAGARWQSAVSRVSGVPQSTLAMIVTKERSVTAEVERAVAEGVIKGADDVIKRANAAKDFAQRLLLTIDKEEKE